MDSEKFKVHCNSIGLNLSDDQTTHFANFEEALYLANERTNLTRVSREDCLTRHFMDSLLLAEFIPLRSKVLDIGTGPGFPAWPLACARPDIEVTALDSNGKMVNFLKTQPLKNLHPVLGRAELPVERESFDFVTGRAVATLEIQLEMSAAYCEIEGVVVPMRTPRDTIEGKKSEKLGLDLVEVATRNLPGTDILRTFPIYRKMRRTPSQFPRSWAEIKNSK